MNFSKLIKKATYSPALVACCGLSLAACGPNAANFSILPEGQNFFQGNTANNKVDILWVIDNSGSMLTKQENLARGFTSFAEVFVNKGFDFHMAIVTSDTRPAGIHLGDGQNGEFQGTPSVITKSTTDFVGAFQRNVVVGATGDSQAKELDAIFLALSPPNLTTSNTGFLRDDAHLAVIILSDADDNDSDPITHTPTDTLNFLQTLKPDKFDVVTKTYKKNFTVSAVAVNSLGDPDCAPLLPLIEEGTKFKTLVNATNGSLASICKADFSEGLSSISQRIAEAVTDIALARMPDPQTIIILFNGIQVPKDPTNGFTYDPSGNKIVFHGSWIPQDNTSIIINYIPNDIIR